MLQQSARDFSTWDQSQNSAYPGWAPGTFPQGELFVNFLQPSQWSPSKRALAFAGYGTSPNGTCGAARLLLQASALACTPTPVQAQIAVADLSSPPTLTSLADVPKLSIS